MTKTTLCEVLLVFMTLVFGPRSSLAQSCDSDDQVCKSKENQEEVPQSEEKIYWEFTEVHDFPYYPEEHEDHGGLDPMEVVHKKMEEDGIVAGQYILDDFVVGGVNLADYEVRHPPFLLYEDFDIGSHLSNQDRWSWKELLLIRNRLERPSLSWYVDKVARKRWFAKEKRYPQPEVYYMKYKRELSETGTKEDDTKIILANLPTKHGFCAKPTHQSMTLGNWLVDIDPKITENEEGAKFTQQAKRVSGSDYAGNKYDPANCADSLAEGLRRKAVPVESWALKNVEPGLVVEELFSHHEDRSLPPVEFNMFVIWGKFYVGQWNEVFDERYQMGFFYRDKSGVPGCPVGELPDWIPWEELVDIAESLGEHKDMFRVDIFVGVPRYSEENAELKIAVSECEIHPTTIFCNPYLAEEMARLWTAGYKIGNYETIPNDEVPSDFVSSNTK